MRDRDGRLLRTYKDGRASLNAYLEDHAFLLEALLVLYEATLETRWFIAARALADDDVERFRDHAEGGFFDTASDHEALVVRPRSFEDHPIPSGNSSAAYALLRASDAVTGEPRLRAAGRRGARHPAPGRRAPSPGVRPPAAGDALPLLDPARGGARGRAAGRARGGRARAVPPDHGGGRHAAA